MIRTLLALAFLQLMLSASGCTGEAQEVRATDADSLAQSDEETERVFEEQNVFFGEEGVAHE